MTKYEQKELLTKISDTLCGIFDGIYGEFDDEMNESICEVEKNVATLLRSFDDVEEPVDVSINYYEFSVPNHLGIEQREHRDSTYDHADDMMRKICQMICFSDCTEECIDKIVYRGKELEYVGWQPDMVFTFLDKKTKEVAWEGCFPDWSH